MNGLLLLTLAWLPAADAAPGPSCNCTQQVSASAPAPTAAAPKESFWQRPGFFAKLRDRFRRKSDETPANAPPTIVNGSRFQPAPTAPVVRDQAPPPAPVVVIPDGPPVVAPRTTTDEPPIN